MLNDRVLLSARCINQAERAFLEAARENAIPLFFIYSENKE